MSNEIIEFTTLFSLLSERRELHLGFTIPGRPSVILLDEIEWKTMKKLAELFFIIFTNILEDEIVHQLLHYHGAKNEQFVERAVAWVNEEV